MIKKVLLVFKYNVLHLDQVSIFTSCSVRNSSSRSIFKCETNKLVSSAKSSLWMSPEQSTKSFIEIMKRSGPILDPCGTPV